MKRYSIIDKGFIIEANSITYLVISNKIFTQNTDAVMVLRVTTAHEDYFNIILDKDSLSKETVNILSLECIKKQSINSILGVIDEDIIYKIQDRLSILLSMPDSLSTSDIEELKDAFKKTEVNQIEDKEINSTEGKEGESAETNIKSESIETSKDIVKFDNTSKAESSYKADKLLREIRKVASTKKEDKKSSNKVLNATADTSGKTDEEIVNDILGILDGTQSRSTSGTEKENTEVKNSEVENTEVENTEAELHPEFFVNGSHRWTEELLLQLLKDRDTKPREEVLKKWHFKSPLAMSQAIYLQRKKFGLTPEKTCNEWTEEKAKEFIEYWQEHTSAETAKKFNLKDYLGVSVTVNRLSKQYNIPLVSKIRRWSKEDVDELFKDYATMPISALCAKWQINSKNTLINNIRRFSKQYGIEIPEKFNSSKDNS